MPTPGTGLGGHGWRARWSEPLGEAPRPRSEPVHRSLTLARWHRDLVGCGRCWRLKGRWCCARRDLWLAGNPRLARNNRLAEYDRLADYRWLARRAGLTAWRRLHSGGRDWVVGCGCFLG